MSNKIDPPPPEGLPAGVYIGVFTIVICVLLLLFFNYFYRNHDEINGTLTAIVVIFLYVFLFRYKPAYRSRNFYSGLALGYCIGIVVLFFIAGLLVLSVIPKNYG
jgi:hypothetical protein